MLLLKCSLLFLVCFFSTFLKFHCMLIENSDSSRLVNQSDLAENKTSYENLTSTAKIQSQLDSVDLYRTREFNETLLQNLTTFNKKPKQVIKKKKNERNDLGTLPRSSDSATSYSAVADVACPTGYFEHPVTHDCLEQL